MGVVEILERAYGEDHREGIAMWSALLYAAGSRLKALREARWLLHSCCPCGMDDLSPELLDELQRDKSCRVSSFRAPMWVRSSTI